MVGTPLPLITGLLKDGSTKRQYKMYLNREVVIGKDLLAGAYGQKYPNLVKIHCRIRSELVSDEQGFRFNVQLMNIARQGTYVNGHLLGVGGSVMLKTNDTVVLPYEDKIALKFVCTIHQPGTFVSEFSVQRKLGEGSYGEVYQCYSRRIGETYAVKAIRNKVARGNRNRVADELNAHRSLRHQNIVRMFAFQSNSTHLYLILEYAPYGDVAKLMTDNGGILNEDTAKHIAHDIASALRYMNEDGRAIAHRDIKPGNALVCKINPLLIKLSDFGCARPISGYTEAQAQSMVGTMHYIAPEIAMAGALHYDTRVDSWSLGVMVFVMLSGRAPFPEGDLIITRYFKSDNRSAVRWKALPPSVSDAARHFMSHLIVISPQGRAFPAAILDHFWFTNEGLPLS